MATKSQASSSKTPFSNVPPNSTPQATSSSVSSATAREQGLIRESVEYELKRLELYEKLEHSNRAEFVAALRSDSLARIQEIEKYLSKTNESKASAHASKPPANLEQLDDNEENIDAQVFHLPSASPTGYEYHILSPITSDSNEIPESVQFQFCHVPLSEEMIPALVMNHSSLFNMVESQLLIINQLIAERNAETSEFGQWVLAGFHVDNGTPDFGVVLKFCGHSESCFQRLRSRPKINLFNQPRGSNLSRKPIEQPTVIFAGSPAESRVSGEPRSLFNQPSSSRLSGNSTKQPTSTSDGSPRGSRVSSDLSSIPPSGGLFGGPTKKPQNAPTGPPGGSKVSGNPCNLPSKPPTSTSTGSPRISRESGEPSGNVTKQSTSTSAGSPGGSRVSGDPSGLSSKPLSGDLFGSSAGQPTNIFAGSLGGSHGKLFPASGIFGGSFGGAMISVEPRKESGDSPGQPTSGERGNVFGKAAAVGGALGIGEPYFQWKYNEEEDI